MAVQRLTKARLDTLEADLVAGGTKTAKGRTRRSWAPVSVNKAIDTWAMVLADAHQQGLVTRNVAEHVAHVAARHKQVDTYTEAEVTTLLAAIADNRLGHAWELALSGLRRGEIAGLAWANVDLKAKTLSITNNRVKRRGHHCGERPEVGHVAADVAIARPACVGAKGGQGPASCRAAGAGHWRVRLRRQQ
jgi:integrase